MAVRKRKLLGVAVPVLIAAALLVLLPWNARPIFGEWSAGDFGFGWRDVQFSDQLNVIAYIDGPRNIVFLCDPAH